MTYNSADEIKEKNIKTMGKDFGEKYSALWQDIGHLHSKWGHYCSLYGDTPEKVDILNKVAPALFKTFERALWRDILIHIARLTDPVKMRAKSNLTLQELPTLVPNKISSEISSRLQEVEDKSKFCRDWRNREIAHNDLAHSLDSSASPLTPASRKKVRDAIDAIAAMMNAVANHIHKSETIFDSLIDFGEGNSLVWYLEKGIKKREEEKQSKLGRTTQAK